MGDIAGVGGVGAGVGDAGSAVPQPQPQPPNPEPSAIGGGPWRRAERVTRAVVRRIQPTVVSGRRRQAVVDYVQRLLKWRIGCEVKLVKCLVQNIVVDISFNQIGGLCTLCFLEQVDQLIGKDHLFKRSIMLIKAWCYYESRILGAHHGLISTYALETLVLYIFHLFHKSLEGPLAVLYKFLDYYSKFDWDNQGVSLYGPVALSSLPSLVAEPLETQDGDLLLPDGFLRHCGEMFSVPPKNFENSTRVFSRKHLNIVDPLKQNNNLGRSVSKGNFYRIRSAFVFGARKLAQILLQPADLLVDEVNMFFRNTLERHGSGERRDVQDSLPACSDGLVIDHITDGSGSLDSNAEKAKKDSSPLLSPTSDSEGALSDQFCNMSISNFENHGILMQKERDPSGEHKEGVSVSGRHFTGDARDLTTTRSVNVRTGNDVSNASSSTSETYFLPSGKAYYAPHQFFQSANGTKNDVKDNMNPSNSGTTTKVSTDRVRHSFEDIGYDDEFSGSSTSLFRHNANSSSTGPVDGSTASSWNTYPSDESHLVDCSVARKEGDGNGLPYTEVDGNGGTKTDNLSDLAGDNDVNFRNLLYAQGCQDYMMNPFYYPMHSPPAAQYRNKHSWNTFNRRNMYRYMGTNGVMPGPQYPPGYYMVRPVVPAYQTEDSPKPRGTGTYFPNTNFRTYKEKPLPGRAKNSMPPNHHQRFRYNGRADVPADMMPFEETSHEPPTQIYIPSRHSRGSPTPSEISPSSPVPRGAFHGNDFLHPQESKLEFGSLGPVPLEVPSQDQGNKVDSAPHSQVSGPVSPMSPVQRSGVSSNRKRSTQPYHLKDDGDFPPLSN